MGAYCIYMVLNFYYQHLMSNSRLTAVAAPEGTGQGVGPTVQHLAEEGNTVQGEDIVRGVGIAQGVGTGRQGTGWQGTGRQGTGHQGTVEVGRQVAGTGEAAHLDLWIIKMM